MVERVVRVWAVEWRVGGRVSMGGEGEGGGEGIGGCGGGMIEIRVRAVKCGIW